MIPEPTTFAELDALVERRKARAAALEAEAAQTGEKPEPVATRIEHETIDCEGCGQPFDSIVLYVDSLPGLRPLRKLYCDPCVFRYRDAQQAERDARPDRWLTLCDAEFRTVDEGGVTVLARLQRDCPKLASVTGWEFGPKGLLVRGDTGKCKTRAVWRLLRAQFDAHRRIFATTAGRLAREFADAAGNHRQGEWFTPMVEADIFFLDDLGKKPWTPNVWAEFFELIDERAKRHRPFIITTNEDSKSLKLKCSDPVTWEPLLRRLTENTAAIVL